MSQLAEELTLDRLIHEPGRLAILTVLSSVADADFVFLQRATGLTKGNLSSHLTKLEDAGLVRRSPDPSDGRVSHVEVTDAGAHLHQRLRAERTQLLAARLAALPDDRSTALLAALPALESLAADLAGPL